MTDLVVRPLAAGEADLFLSMPDDRLVGVQLTGRDYRATVERREYRPEWTWVALRGDTVVARAAWWAGPDDDKPITLDWFDFTDDDAGLTLLAEANLTTEYTLILPPNWRADPAVRAAAEARRDLALRSGMKPFVERFRYDWTPENGLPDRPGRLRYRPEPDDDVILDVLRRMIHGSLDAHQRRFADREGAVAAARDDLEFLRWMPSPRAWWRLAYTVDGALVGLTVPGANFSGPVIGIVGVVPEQRGHGYAYDLLVEATHLLVETGATRITAETDTTNTPMAATFARAGYPVTQERVYLQ